MDLTVDERRILLEAARCVISKALGHPLPEIAIPHDATALHQSAGCFVTLHNARSKRLRGCIGRLDARKELIEAVRHSAVNVLTDPRFEKHPVQLNELPELEIEITVIFPLQPATSCLDFEPLDEGIYLKIGDRTGCFLPQVAREMGWSREQLLNRLCSEKLELDEDAWQGSDAKLMKFSTLIIGPEPFGSAITQKSDF